MRDLMTRTCLPSTLGRTERWIGCGLWMMLAERERTCDEVEGGGGGGSGQRRDEADDYPLLAERGDSPSLS